MLRVFSRSTVSAPKAPAATQKISFVNHNRMAPSAFAFKSSARFFATKQLYVGNIPWTTTESELRDLFAEHGKVHQVRVATDRQTGRAKGFAFITMDEEAIQTAIGQMDGKPFGGRTIRVNEAREDRPFTPRTGGGFGGQQGGGQGRFNDNQQGGGFRGGNRGFNNNQEE